MPRTFLILALVATLCLLGQMRLASGYALEGPKWPNGNITMDVQLNSGGVAYPPQQTGGFFPTYELQDGTPSWNAVAEDAMADWNQYLLNVQFNYNETVLPAPAERDGINSVFFSSSVYGQTFGTGGEALAVTVYFYHTTTNLMAETDIVVNTNETWDSYRGNLQYSYANASYTYDLRRVLDHELGHVLGLDHPDQANPPQNVTAIMNSTVSDLDHIELDDIQGAWFLYGQKTVLEPVTATASPSNAGTVSGTGNLQLGSTQQLTATPAPGYSFYQWDDGTTNPTRTITVPVGGATYTATFVLALDNFVSRYSASNLNSMFYANGQFYVSEAINVPLGEYAMLTSPDGANWTSHTTNIYPPYYNKVAYGNGIFVYLFGTDVATSTDAITWTDNASTLPNQGGVIAYGNGIFVVPNTAVGDAETAFNVSTDGVHWTAYSTGIPDFIVNSMTYGNGKFVAIGSALTGYCSLVSTDGMNWTSGPTINRQVSSLCYGNGIFVATSAQSDYIFSSTDGLNWQAVTYPGAQTYEGDIIQVAYGDGIFVAMTSYEILTSSDAVTWTLMPNNGGYGQSIAFGAGTFEVQTSESIEQSGVVLPQVVTPTLPSISNSSPVYGTVGAAFRYQIVATNSPVAYNAFGLPAGLSLNIQTGVITGMPTGAGTSQITLVATNDGGSTLANLTLGVGLPTTPQSFSDWENSHFFTGTATGISYGDGVPNFMKYFYGINPSNPMSATDHAAMPTVGTDPTGDFLTLTYRQNPAATNITVNVLTSSDLVNWSTPPSYSLLQIGTDNATGDPIMEVKVPITTSGTQFIELNVTSP